MEASMHPVQEADKEEVRSLTPDLPVYSEARHFLRVMNNVSYALYRSTYNAIWEQRGSPKEQVDWLNPDEWIPLRLKGEEQFLALRIWRESNREFNPRYLRGNWYLTTKHGLLREASSGKLEVTGRGQQFLNEAEGKVIAEIDNYEGILVILRQVAERGSGRQSDFLPYYAEFCRTFTGYRSDTPIRGSLYDRLINLIQRQYVTRSGQVYEVTDKGLAYLDKFAQLVHGQPREVRSKQSELRKLAKEMREEARQQLGDYLANMNPFKFESLIKFLLEEMGYHDVEVTSPTNDKGVDVVANVELGISSVREVVQAKRYRGNINRQVLDQLRGSLHRFDAVRGTIISTGGFSKGTLEAAFERGAAPITLIDGEKLLDLLIQHEIGVSKQEVDYLEFNATKLAQFDSKEAEESTLENR